MFKKSFFVWVPVAALMVAGCATGRNYQSDIDSLNSRINGLQGELSSKDQEISKLQSQLGDQQQSMAQLEGDRRRLQESLDAKDAELAAKKKAKASYDSDLK